MKKKNLWGALLCTGCLAVSSVFAPMTALAEETETAAESTEEMSEEETQDEDFEEPDLNFETEAAVHPEYDASDYVELGEYKGLTVEVEPFEVTEDEINETLFNYATWSECLDVLTEGVVQNGDMVNIDYEGKMDGEAFDGGTDKGADLTIGSGQFIEGFESGLIGVKVGETVDLQLTFPEIYVEDLAGKEVVFTVTVNEIKRLPELTAENVSIMSDGQYSDPAAYRDSIRTQLLEEKESERDYIIEEDLMTQLANISVIKSYPEELIQYWVTTLTNEYKIYASFYGMDFETFLSAAMGYTVEEFEAEARLAAEELAYQEMLMQAVAEKEDLVLSEEEFRTAVEALAKEEGFEGDVEGMLEAYGEDSVRKTLQQKAVLEFLIANADIQEIQPETETETGMEAESGAAESEAETVAETEAAESETAAETETEA